MSVGISFELKAEYTSPRTWMNPLVPNTDANHRDTVRYIQNVSSLFYLQNRHIARFAARVTLVYVPRSCFVRGTAV